MLLTSNMFFNRRDITALIFLLQFTSSWCYTTPLRGEASTALSSPPKLILSQRRSFLRTSHAAISAFVIAIRPKSSGAEPGEFKSIDTQTPLPRGKEEEAPFQTMPDGVKIKEFKVGSGGEVMSGSIVSVQLVGRLLNLNGVPFYDTKENDPDGFGAEPLTFKVGAGEALPGLEIGIIGMKRGGIRRIIVPSELGYSKFPGMEPRPTNELDLRALESVINNPRRDASLLFDVKLERLK